MLRSVCLLAVPAARPDPAPRRTSSGCSRAALEMQQAGDLLGAIDTYKTALAIIPIAPTRCRIWAPPTCIWGSSTTRSSSTKRRCKIDPTNTAIRLNLALAYYKSARPNEAIQQLKRDRRVGARREERVPGARRLLSADRAGSGGRRAAEAARARCSATTSRMRTCSARRCSRPATTARGSSTSTASSAPASRPKRTC